MSPPLFESLELLGRDRSLSRLREAPRAGRGGGITRTEIFGSVLVGPQRLRGQAAIARVHWVIRLSDQRL